MATNTLSQYIFLSFVSPSTHLFILCASGGGSCVYVWFSILQVFHCECVCLLPLSLTGEKSLTKQLVERPIFEKYLQKSLQHFYLFIFLMYIFSPIRSPPRINVIYVPHFCSYPLEGIYSLNNFVSFAKLVKGEKHVVFLCITKVRYTKI